MALLLKDDFGLSKAPRYAFLVYAIVEFLCDIFFIFYFFSTKTIQRRRELLGLKSSNQLKATFEVLEPCIKEIRERFPTMGQRQMRSLLLQDYGMKVNECVLFNKAKSLMHGMISLMLPLVRKTIGQFLKLKEPERVQMRHHRVRRQPS